MRSSVHPPVWLWLNLLGLDAPLVALVWQDFLFRCYPTTLHAVGRAVLGLTVWAIYLADRLLDTRRPAVTETIRSGFYRQYRSHLMVLLAAVASVDLLLCGFLLRPVVLANGIFVAGFVAAYLIAFPITGWGAAAWKKPLAAFLFTSGTFLIEWTSAGHGVSRLLWPAAAFCALCLTNLLAVGNRHREVRICCAALCVCLATAGLWFTTIVASALGLYALTRWGRRLSAEACSVLADTALLTPLLFQGARFVRIL